MFQRGIDNWVINDFQLPKLVGWRLILMTLTSRYMMPEIRHLTFLINRDELSSIVSLFTSLYHLYPYPNLSLLACWLAPMLVYSLYLLCSVHLLIDIMTESRAVLVSGVSGIIQYSEKAWSAIPSAWAGTASKNYVIYACHVTLDDHNYAFLETLFWGTTAFANVFFVAICEYTT